MIEYTERYFRGLDLWSLGVDEAFVNATVGGLRGYYLYSLSDECDKVRADLVVIWMAITAVVIAKPSLFCSAPIRRFVKSNQRTTMITCSKWMCRGSWVSKFSIEMSENTLLIMSKFDACSVISWFIIAEFILFFTKGLLCANLMQIWVSLVSTIWRWMILLHVIAHWKRPKRRSTFICVSFKEW